MACTKIHCPMNASTISPDCDVEGCPWRTTEKEKLVVIMLPYVVNESRYNTLLAEFTEQVKNGVLLLPNDYKVMIEGK